MSKVRLLCFCSLVLWPIASLAEQIVEINEQIPTDGIGVTHISGYTFQNKEVFFDKKKDLAIFEGDIILGTLEQAAYWQAVQESIASFNPGLESIIITADRYRWTNNLVPYQFAENVTAPDRTMVLSAIAHWEANTPMRFVERNVDNAADYPDYVNVVSDDFACWSYVGRIGGEQELNVVGACGFGATVHEFGHAIGLWHEQSREDRDTYVQINWENIEIGNEHNFNQQISNGTDIGVYDYGSIMHYGAFDFNKEGSGPTITPLQPVAIGQRSGLSDLDIASIFLNYPDFMPIASISKDTYSVFLGNSITLDGSQSFDPNDDDLDYFWSFGDGQVNNTDTVAEHTYEATGNFDISLTVTDPNSNESSDTASAVVYGAEVLIPIITLPLY